MTGTVPTRSSKDKEVEQAKGRRREPARGPALSGPQAGILDLQRAAGNQAVIQLLQPDAGETSTLDGDGPVETAENSLLKPLPRATTSAMGVRGLPSVVRSVLAASGKPLDPAPRASMESRLGYDLGHVRVYSGPQAARSAEAVNASAYTVGRDIVFGAGQYAPNTTAGLQLLAHELAHAIQQTPSGQNAPALSPHSPSERAADAAARSVVSGMAPVPANATGMGIARQLRRRNVKDLKDEKLISEFKMVQDRLDEPHDYAEREADELYAQELIEAIAQRGLATSSELEPTSVEEPAGPTREVGSPKPGASRVAPRPRVGDATERKLEAARKVVDEGAGQSIMKPGRIAREEWKLRARPLPTDKALKRLKWEDRVFVERLYKRPQDDLGWYYIYTSSGDYGWVRSDGVALDPPDPDARLHRVESNEKLINIAAHYSFKWGQDARYFVFGLAWANRDREGIMFPSGWTDRDWQKTTKWKDIWVKAGMVIWLPSKQFMLSLRGKFSSGSITFDLWQDIKHVAKVIWDWAKFGAGFVAGLVQGALESIYDLFAGAVELIKSVWSVVKSLFTGNIVKDAKALWNEIKNLDLVKMGQEFWKKWTADDPWDRGRFQGHVFGYVIVEVLLAIFSVGALTAIKWAGRFAKVANVLSKVEKVAQITSRLSKVKKLKELPSRAVNFLRNKFGRRRTKTPDTKSKPDTREPVRVFGGRRRLTRADMLRFEDLGGHTLQRHGSQHTRRTLLNRILGEGEDLAPRDLPGGVRSTDFRVWKGNKSGAASRWIDEEAMHRAISGIINDHIDEIERAARTGGSFPPLERIPVGRRVGEGWVKLSAAPAGQRGVFWRDDLRRATVVIRSDGGGGWYVHTAYPE